MRKMLRLPLEIGKLKIQVGLEVGVEQNQRMLPHLEGQVRFLLSQPSKSVNPRLLKRCKFYAIGTSKQLRWRDSSTNPY